ncbi:ABC transporter substrate-binding protein [Bradyrhizobium sp. HKCCYLS2038]|uniref:ABC transporter substrate-binding protein n=1 Tax=unclassified Bradyrhizobium TaxID=2631580 RepID=UPI003EB6C389
MPRILLSLLVACWGLITLPSRAAELASVTLAWSPNPQTPQIDVALARSLFREAGLDVKTVPFASGREAFEALVGGQIDLAFMAELPATIGAMRAQPFAVIADLSRYRGSRLIANAKFLDLRSVKDVAGRKVGLTVGANLDYFASRLFAREGIAATIVNAAPPDLVPAMVRGDIEVAVPFPTFYEAAAKALGPDYRELRSSDYAVHNIIAASSVMLKSRSDVVEKFVSALLKADAIIRQEPALVQQLVADNMNGGFSVATLGQMWPDFDFATRLDDQLVDLLVDQGAWLVEKGAIKGSKPTREVMRTFVNETALKKLAPSMVQLQ